MTEIVNKQKKYKINQKKYKTLVENLIQQYRLKNPEVALAFVDTRTIKALNHKFLKTNKPTDVLSFPLGEKCVDGKFYLGDIIICVPQARQQSSRFSHSLERELEFLTIHGFLHLLGFDHGQGFEEEEKKIRKILDKD